MRYGILSGALWGLDTVILGMALVLAPFLGAPHASLAGALLHDVGSAIILLVYMGLRGRLRHTLAAARTRSGRAVMIGALMGGPLGMSGYLIAINNIGPGYTAIISSYYPALGAFLAFVLLKAALSPATVVVALAALAGTVSYLYYYRAIAVIGASRGMALNISYSAWTVVFALVLTGSAPTPLAVGCCIVILAGTVLAATPDLADLLPRRSRVPREILAQVGGEGHGAPPPAEQPELSKPMGSAHD